MPLLIIGADGQLGTELIGLETTAIPLTIRDIDITDAGKCEEILSKHKPEVVINTAAFNDVDGAEDLPEPAFRVNTLGARNLSLACKKTGAALVHISTDYVFSGDKGAPYLETDAPAPISTYGISKLAGEAMVRYLLPDHYIIRTSGLFGAAGCLGKGGTNFVEEMIRKAGSGRPIKIVNDEIMSPTYARDLAGKIYEIIEKKSFGLYHVTNSGQCSWYEFALKIFECLKLPVTVVPVSAGEFNTRARRPGYSVLAHQRLQTLGLGDLRPWPEALLAYMKEKKYLASE